MRNKNHKKIIVSVTSDLVTDNRVHKVCTTLHNMGFDVLLLGRKLPASLPVGNRAYSTRRFNLLFKKGLFFYAEYNIRLFLFLLFRKADVLLSNDLDTLPANFLVSKIRKKTLVYDSHEFFTEVPELINRPRVKKFWETLEKKIVPQLKFAITVCDSIAAIYRQKYLVPFAVVRNFPVASYNTGLINKTKKKEKIILYQGAVNVGRGLEQAILSMRFIENAKLVIAGDGDIKNELGDIVRNQKLQDKVEFTGRLPIDVMAKLTPQADLGLSIEEDLGLNYRFALPNKLFDYIQAGVPVLITRLPEMAAIVEKYAVGEITGSLEPRHLAGKISDALFNREKRRIWEENLPHAAKELTWEMEEKVIAGLFRQFL